MITNDFNIIIATIQTFMFFSWTFVIFLELSMIYI